MAGQRTVVPRRGDVFLVNFDPTLGSEIGRTRPALVIQGDVANTYSPVTIVAAITSYRQGAKLYPTDVFLQKCMGGIDKDSVVVLNQIRTVDKRRLRKRLGSIDEETAQAVNRALLISVGIVRF